MGMHRFQAMHPFERLPATEQLKQGDPNEYKSAR